MHHPTFKNVHYETILFYPVPEGITVTIRPGEYVMGLCFRNRTRKGVFVEVTELEEVHHIPPKLLKYKQK
jgi:hypothetical protein